LYLSAGQSLKFRVQDWVGQLKGRGVWMIRVIEALRWTPAHKDKRRTIYKPAEFFLFANHHELDLPRKIYDEIKSQTISPYLNLWWTLDEENLTFLPNAQAKNRLHNP
jgi:hypothetical protein